MTDTVSSRNPTTGEVLDTFRYLDDGAIDRALQACVQAQRSWRRTPFADRAGVLQRVAKILRDDEDAHARRMALEMGKPLEQGRSEVKKCAWVCEYYASQAEQMLADHSIPTDARRSYVHCEPLGVVLAVMPWNFPMWQVFRFAAPGLMAGNGALLKHAPNVFGTAHAIQEIFESAGAPEGLFTNLIVDVPEVQRIIADHRVQAVTLTGSTRAGRAVAEQAGRALKKTVLELGGSDAYVILDDADLEVTAELCATSRLINSGQSCIAAKRFLVTPRTQKAFEGHLVAAMSKRTVADPLAEGTDVGPQARQDLRDALHEQVHKSLHAGARRILGSDPSDGPGAFYPISVLTDVPEDAPAATEELFGPVAAIQVGQDEQDLIRLANRTVFGLGGAVFSQDVERAERIAAEHLEAGCCFVNTFVRSDPRLPFGGIKESGYGRELGTLGIREFVNEKTVYVA